ncbi:MAG: hypothetical protein JWP97_6065 [Labilithrix sp.]|nr:hypothetical protein [Labilithrix sp.]
MSEQLRLFGPAEHAAFEGTAVAPLVAAEDQELAERVPTWLHLGTSSWSFPGWRGILYEGAPSEQELGRAGLVAYAQQPLFRTASVDRSFYGPLRAEDVASYAAQLEAARVRSPALPPFRLVSKVWEEITTAVFPRHPRYGARAGEPNPCFLDVGRFRQDVLEPYREHARHFGPFVFTLTPMPRGALSDRALTERVAAFLEALPQGPSWAFELRNAELMTPRWFDVLRAHRAAHVFTYWTATPSLRAQLSLHGPVTAPFVVTRLMLPPFTRYADKQATFAPFDKRVAPQPDMHDDVLDILRAAAAADVSDAFVLVNNKAEGSAPLTVREVARRVVRERF